MNWRAWLFNWSEPDNKHIRAAMVTPLFVMRDADTARLQAEQLAGSRIYNSVASLVDLQRGRPYIEDGRGPMSLKDVARRNIRTVLKAGLTPIIIIRNDWAVRTGQAYIPSCKGPTTAAQFYSSAALMAEKMFLGKLREFWPYCHFQLNIEPDSHLSAQFALDLAKWLRGAGFKNRILVNPYKEAEVAHERIRGELAKLGVDFARSLSGTGLGSDPVINLDGNLTVNAVTAKAWISKLQASRRDWILWSKQLANTSGRIEGAYL
jgi:hypothetical protein